MFETERVLPSGVQAPLTDTSAVTMLFLLQGTLWAITEIFRHRRKVTTKYVSQSNLRQHGAALVST